MSGNKLLEACFRISRTDKYNVDMCNLLKVLVNSSKNVKILTLSFCVFNQILHDELIKFKTTLKSLSIQHLSDFNEASY